jgi:hypothetical protein
MPWNSPVLTIIIMDGCRGLGIVLERLSAAALGTLRPGHAAGAVLRIRRKGDVVLVTVFVAYFGDEARAMLPR